MADYISSTQSRTSHEDMNVLLSAYTRMLISKLPDDEMDSRIAELKEWASRASSNIHKSVEVEIVVRDGSIIVEVIVSGHLHEIFNIDNLRDIGLLLKEADIIDGYLSYCALRGALRQLIKDISQSTAALSRMTRWIFKLKMSDFQRSEARTGIFGNLSRFLDAIDSAKSMTVSSKIRKESIGRAYKCIKKMEQVSTNIGDRKILCFYIGRDMQGIQEISILKSMSKKEIEYASEFNSYLKSINELCDKFCNS